MKWVKLTKPNGDPVFVNLAVMGTIEKSSITDETVISAPMVALAGAYGSGGREWFNIAVKETPDEIMSQSCHPSPI
ncbi:MAG: hypothetical protein KGL39_51210 [Patescibacteria group bacterium]|nr:hypothetical protein [Patescibacteria group bacterium]